MATNKPRITITLNQRTYAVVKAISDLGGKPMSAFVAEMLDSALPTLERMAATFQVIKGAQETERGKFLASLDRAQSSLEPAVMEAVGQFDLFLATVETAVSDGGHPGGEAPAEIANPRPVTRGSTPLIRKKLAASTATTKASTRAASGRKP
jgi:uncharacterized protein (DUF1778 family)